MVGLLALLIFITLPCMNRQETSSTHQNTSALQGMKVLELGQLIAGPFAAKT